MSEQPTHPQRWLLSFDFDGTLHDPSSTPPVPTEFFEQLSTLRKNREIVWGINTGRSLEYALEGLRESNFPFDPDWLVTREREVHLRSTNQSWEEHTEWNHRCAQDIQGLFESEDAFLSRIRREVFQHTGAEWLSMDGEPAGIISRTEEEMEWIVSRVEALANPQSNMSWQRNSIYLRFSHSAYHKGSCLSEVARLFGIPTSHCFAIGDSHNDLEMLDPAHARMIACPANALELVQEKVRKQDGYVTPHSHGQGVVQAFAYYFP